MAFRDEMREKIERYFRNYSESKSEVKTAKQITRDICDMLPDKSYDDGLNEGWENARKVVCRPMDGGFNVETLDKIFGSFFIR